MNLLIVEDDEDMIAAFEGEFPADGPCKAFYARSKDSAEALIKTEIFDFVVLDLKIPTQDKNLDAEIDHGLAVHTLVQENAPGTPVLVFSAFGTVDLASSLAEKSLRLDIWGNGWEQPMTICREKSDLTKCLKIILEVIDHVGVLSGISISTGGKDLGLSEEQKRTLRIYARRYHGTNVRVSALGGGLSDAKTVRVEILDQNSNMKSLAVAKLGTIRSLQDELRRYDEFIKPVLPVGGFAHFIDFVRVGSGPFGGIFYGFGSAYQNSLLNVLQRSAAQAPAIVGDLQKMESPWQQHSTTRTITVMEIRRLLIPDDKFLPVANVLDFDWNAFEQNSVQMKWCCQHCDLHGLNVLFDGTKPLLIDYGAVESGPACLDPLILELSLLFHPACAPVRGAWPTAAQALTWSDEADFVAGTPLAPFIAACRKWAFTVEPVDKAVYSTAYAFAVRQLKYSGDTSLACAIAKSAFTAFMKA